MPLLLTAVILKLFCYASLLLTALLPFTTTVCSTSLFLLFTASFKNLPISKQGYHPICAAFGIFLRNSWAEDEEHYWHIVFPMLAKIYIQ
ncbi:hypothetical protein BDP27DRAFT_671962 [Rhodocollybia butyracea]|uniref:Uncharacterized protein n=1 Tax=Rhodocollybia butyracea TaxID=206335 RepID=A0A9P5PPH8_9AGAR|nr:hypothetical protein BDP27DRAFT_671962 [Rhodocollybia butyracea]